MTFILVALGLLIVAFLAYNKGYNTGYELARTFYTPTPKPPVAAKPVKVTVKVAKAKPVKAKKKATKKVTKRKTAKK